MAIITKTKEEIRKYFTEEMCRKEIEAAKKLPFVYDPDCPPLTEEQLKKFHRVRPRPAVG